MAFANFYEIYDYDYGMETNTSGYLQLANCTNMTFLDTFEFGFIEKRLVPMIFILIFVVGIFGNSLVVVVFIKNPGFRTITNMFLLNLTVIDLVYLFICVPVSTTNSWMGYWPFGNVLCKIQTYLMVVCMSVHVMTLIAIGIDRYMVIVHPVFSRSYRTSFRTLIIVFGIWGISLLAFIPIILITKEIPYFERFYCIENLEPDQLKAYTTLIFILFYGIPQIILGYFYLQIVRKMRSIANTSSRLNRMRLATLKTRRRVLKVLFAVTLTFALCWLPFHSAAIIREFGSSSSLFAYYLQIFSPCFSYASTALNPVIYCFLSKTFRNFFKATFTCQSINVNPMSLGDEAEVVPRIADNNGNDRNTEHSTLGLMTSSKEKHMTSVVCTAC